MINMIDTVKSRIAGLKRLRSREGREEVVDGIVKYVSKSKAVLVENWQSGIPGKIFLIVAGIIVIWLFFPLLGVRSTSDDVYRTPASVIKHYYKMYKECDWDGYLSCVDYDSERREEMMKVLELKSENENWDPKKIYGDVVLGVPAYRGDGKMSVKVCVYSPDRANSVNIQWSLIKTKKGWLIDSSMNTNPQDMGLEPNDHLLY